MFRIVTTSPNGINTPIAHSCFRLASPINIFQLARVLFMVVITSTLVGVPSALSAGALHDAVRNKDVAAVEAALAGDTDVDESDYVLGTALHIATLDGSEDIAGILLRHGADVDAASELQSNRPLHLAAEFGRASMIELLLDNGATVDAKNDIQRTPLMLAAATGNVEVVRILLDRGADIETRESRQENTPLIIAAVYGQLEIVNLLIEEGADIHATDREGRTALRVAATPPSYNRVGGPALIEYLASKGADLNARDDSGLSILEFAKDRSTGGDFYWAEIIKTLERLGATE